MDPGRGGRPEIQHTSTSRWTQTREAAMPKNKTHSGAKKRFRVTGSGKLMRERAGKRHLLEVKSSTRKDRLSKDVEVSAADTKAVKRMLGL